MTSSHLTHDVGPWRTRRGWQHIFPCLPPDAVVIARQMAASGPAKRECPGCEKHRYLDDMISKPWGEELRVYDDAFIDAWLLRLDAGMRTSTHGHARKDTVLLCLRGSGKVTAGDGRSVPIRPGSMVHIDQGAVHCTLAGPDELRLVEIETPRDKLDVVRVQDDNGRAGQPYEAAGDSDGRLGPLEDVEGGPPRARLRRRCPWALHSFAVERGERCVPHDGLMFAIDLDTESVMRRQLSVLGPGAPAEPVHDHLYMTIRTNHEEQ